MPRTDPETKAALAKDLTEAFTAATPFPAEIFGIRFAEYDPGHAASGGRIITSDDERPYLHMLFYSPRLDRKTKQALVKGLTEAFTKVLGKPAWKPVIHLCEHPYDNVGVDGQLLSDAYSELAEREFYYPLG